MALSPTQRQVRARIGAHEKWAQCGDASAATAPGRAAFDERFYDGLEGLPEEERERRAAHARKAYFARLALKSAIARRRKAEAVT